MVVASDGPAALRRWLSDLCEQPHLPRLEIVVVDATGHVTASDLAGAPAGQARLITAAGRDVALLRTLGARAATGELVAFSEDHARLPAGWCATLVRLQAAGLRAFGGPIENGPFRAPADWAAYLMEFSAFMPPARGGPTDILPGTNAVYERSLLDGLLDASLCEPIVSRRLREQGVALHLEPDLVVTFERRYGVRPFARHCFSSGQTFARLRLARLPLRSRVAYAVLAATALPPVLVARIVARAVGRPQLIRALPAALPWVVFYSAAWGLGEAAGALAARRARAEATPEMA